MKNMKETWLYITKWKKSAWDSERWVIARSSGEKAEGLTRETGEFKVGKNMWHYTVMAMCDLTHYGNNG